ncbi:MAG: tRNA 2-thiouridine(34) synthase MnmA [Anaerolineales bacterium]|nr:tRNA 2-thiouridine(34) synthase MnmA [Anaerolineales bacterium]
MSNNRTVAVAMSGGVDSSVTAALLVEQGEDVIGVMMNLWSDADRPNRCCSPEAMSIARRVAAQLGIPFYALDARQPFRKHVVDTFIEGYAQGITPNPCIACNRYIRWGFLLQQTRAMGATHLSTGHYARIIQNDGHFHLLRGIDRIKDQSYVLSILTQDHLAHTILPLGEYKKSDVRELARQYQLPVADREESQDLCFVGDEGYYRFIYDRVSHLLPGGPIFHIDGSNLGEHRGLAGYTIGQRKGIGVSFQYPLYVVEKDVSRNALVVGPLESLGRRTFTVDRVNWILGSAPQEPIQVCTQVRYKAREVESTLHALDNGNAKVVLSEPVPDITPGQLAVFYIDDECIGGGIILP